MFADRTVVNSLLSFVMCNSLAKRMFHVPFSLSPTAGKLSILLTMPTSVALRNSGTDFVSGDTVLTKLVES